MTNNIFSLPNTIIILLILSLTACSTVGVREQSMVADCDYDNLITHFHKNYNYDTADIGTLDALCQAYFETRKYNRFMECSEILTQKAPKEGLQRTTTTKRKMGIMVGGLFGGMMDSYLTEYFSYEDIIAPILTKRAMVALDFEDYRKAIEFSDQSIVYLTDSQTKHQELLLEAYGVSGLACALVHDLQKAGARIASILDMKIENEDLDLLRQTALIKIYMALKEYKKAKNVMTSNTSSSFLTFVNSIDIGWKTTGRELKNIEIPNRFMKAKVFYETGDLDTAKKEYDMLINEPHFKNLGSAYIVALYDRGIIANNDGNKAYAVMYLKKAVEMIEHQRSTINTEASKIGFVGDKQAVYQHLVKILYDNGQYENAFEYVERSKSRALVDLLATKKNFAAKEGSATDIRGALDQVNIVDHQSLTNNVSLETKRIRSIQTKARDYLETKTPELASLVTVSSPSISELKALIPLDDVLIEYYYKDKDMYAFVLSQDGLEAIRINSKGLREDIQEYRKTVGPENSNRQINIAKKLYLRLLQPIERFLHKPNLTIVPHGVLHYLPMSALYDGNEYLIDRYSIRIIPSASTIKYLKNTRIEKSGGILAFGNPDLGNAAYDLTFAQDEAIEVAKTQSNSVVFLRKEATEDALVKYGTRYDYIHFATHGAFNPETPLKSALFLAPDAQHDGILTVEKLYSMQLNTKLITMSACETGISQIANGDDMIGLARGCLYAGANAIVASLWKVDDLSTATLMTHFYNEMKNTDMRKALRTAQLETKKRYPNPYYWAAFQLTGGIN